MGKKFTVGSVLFRIFLYFYAVISLYPIVWMFFYSFKNNSEIFVTNPFGFPKIFHWENYVKAWTTFNVPTYFMNSLKVTLVVIAVVVVISTMFAYAVARLRFKGSDSLRMSTMIGMFLPLQCIMIPLAVLVRDLHISNTLWAVIVPYIAFNIPFAVMVIYGYMRSLPYELEESACIDGASLWTCFIKVIVWNEYNLALVLLNRDAIKTLPLGMIFFKGEHTTDWGAMGATMVIASIPTIIIYILFSAQVEKAMTVSGAVKG